MSLSTIAVGALIRQEIEKEKKLEIVKSIPIPQKIIKNQMTEYHDINGISFFPGSKYLGQIVYGIVKCTALHNKENRTYKAKFYPINKKEQILKPNGYKSGMKYHAFKNAYNFELQVIVKKEKTEAQKTASYFSYRGEEKYSRDTAGKKAQITAYFGVILETIIHCRDKKNMTILTTDNIVNDLKKSTYWIELGKPESQYYRFYNKTMGSTIWKFRGKWIISSHSSYLKLVNDI